MFEDVSLQRRVVSGVQGFQPTALAVRFAEKVRERRSGCHEWVGSTDGRYGIIFRDGKRDKAHRVAWELQRGPVPAGMRVLHRCDNPACVNVEHLFLGTQAENVRDMYAKQRNVARLSPSEVQAIREMRGRMTQAQIGLLFGVHRCTVRRIQLGHTNRCGAWARREP